MTTHDDPRNGPTKCDEPGCYIWTRHTHLGENVTVATYVGGAEGGLHQVRRGRASSGSGPARERPPRAPPGPP